ncbi:MAG TPA: hypothetical protein IAC12_03670 [Candidatus Aphodovivens avistercoris]|nr:hypothetical protein [Candidatus Aphodovivens avistercoris]
MKRMGWRAEAGKQTARREACGAEPMVPETRSERLRAALALAGVFACVILAGIVEGSRWQM